MTEKTHHCRRVQTGPEPYPEIHVLMLIRE